LPIAVEKLFNYNQGEKLFMPKSKVDYPEGNILYCEVKYRVSFRNGKFKDGSWELHWPYSVLIPTPSAAYTLIVSALRVARRFLWDRWKDEIERLKKETDEIDEVWFIRTEYWTNKIPSRPKVTKFIRLHVAPPTLAPGQESSPPDSDLSEPPSEF